MNEITGFVAATPADFASRDARSYTPSNLASDPLRHLPQAAADKLQKLQLRVEDLRLLCPSFEQRNEATNEKLAAERRLKRVVDHPAQGGFGLPEDNQSVVDAQREVKRLSAEARRIDDLYTARSAAWSAASQTLAAVQAWLKEGRPHGTALEPVSIEAPKLNKNETIIDGIDRLRRRRSELRADLHRIQSAPYPSTHARASMRETVEAWAQRGAISVSGLLEHDSKIEIPTQRVTSQVIGSAEGALAFAQIPDIGLLAWLCKDFLVKRLEAEIAAAADDRNALSPEARQRQEAEVQADLLSVERDECALVWTAQAQGLPVEHRSDISPLALLNLRLVTIAPAAAPPVSTPEHAWPISIGS